MKFYQTKRANARAFVDHDKATTPQDAGAAGSRLSKPACRRCTDSDDPARESRFVRECARAGVLVKRGAYDFAAIAHDEEAVREVEAAVSGALVAMAESERER